MKIQDYGNFRRTRNKYGANKALSLILHEQDMTYESQVITFYVPHKKHHKYLIYYISWMTTIYIVGFV